jgi:hypothetical protein
MLPIFGCSVHLDASCGMFDWANTRGSHFTCSAGKIAADVGMT